MHKKKVSFLKFFLKTFKNENVPIFSTTSWVIMFRYIIYKKKPILIIPHIISTTQRTGYIASVKFFVRPSLYVMYHDLRVNHRKFPRVAIPGYGRVEKRFSAMNRETLQRRQQQYNYRWPRVRAAEPTRPKTICAPNPTHGTVRCSPYVYKLHNST